MKETLSIGVAATPEDLQSVYVLRHEAYREPTPEFAGPGPGMHDVYDGAPNCISYLMKGQNGEPVGSIRPCIYSPAFGWARVPAFDVFADELRSEIGDNTAIVQSTHFVMSAAHRGFSLGPKLILFKEILRTAVLQDAPFITTIVRNTEALLNFYENIGLFRVGPVKMHPEVQRDAVLIVAKRDEMIRRVSESRVFRPMLPEEARTTSAS